MSVECSVFLSVRGTGVHGAVHVFIDLLPSQICLGVIILRRGSEARPRCVGYSFVTSEECFFTFVYSRLHGVCAGRVSAVNVFSESFVFSTPCAKPKFVR